MKNNEITKYILENNIRTYLKNTVIILFWTNILSITISFIFSYIVVFYDFKFKKTYEYLLILPFAIPSYLFGYIYVDLFSYSGLLSYFIKKNFDKIIYYDIMNIKGVIFILTISFYPYIYIILKSYMKKMDNNIIEASKNLGISRFKTLFSIILPLSIPAIISGSILLSMEVLNAFGVPYYFGVEVFSTGIYNAFISYKDFNSTLKLSFILFCIILSILFVLNIFKKNRKYEYTNTKIVKIKEKEANLFENIFFNIILFLFTCITLFIPLIYLLRWAFLNIDENYYEFVIPTLNTLKITSIATLLICIISILLNQYIRYNKSKINDSLIKLSTMGYSISGIVIAIGVYISILFIQNNLTLTLTLIPLTIGYVIRFLILSYNSIEAGFNKIGNTFSESALTLGSSKLKVLLKIEIPMIKLNIFSGIILVFIEIIKELPLTSILSPFNFNTLSLIIKNYADQEILYKTAIPSLIIISISIILLFIFNILENVKRK